jgi:tetratricopeptide (TPR) repeat protein
MGFSLGRALVACSVACGIAFAQDLVVRVQDAPDFQAVKADLANTAVNSREISRTPDVLIVLSAEFLSDEDFVDAQRTVLTTFQALRGKIPFRLGVVRGAAIELAGPFRTDRELRAALRATRLEPGTPQVATAAPFLMGLADSLESIPSNWGFALLIGRMPPLTVFSDDSEVGKYAIAWLTRRFLNQKRSLLFWEPSATSIASWAQTLTRNTGGFVARQPAELAQDLMADETLVAVDISRPLPIRGFRLDSLSISGIPEVATPIALISASTPALLEIDQFIELRKLTEALDRIISNSSSADSELSSSRLALEKALALNPSDWTALSLGMKLMDRQHNPAGKLPLLRYAVDLNPDDVDLWQSRGDIEYESGDFTSAESSLLRAAQLGAKGARLSERLGRIRFDAKDYLHAAPLIAESLLQDPRKQSLWFLSAEIAKATGDAGHQIDSLEQALVLGGTHYPERAALIQLYLEHGDKVKAAHHVDLEVGTLPEDADLQATWAKFYHDLSRPADELLRWKEVVRLDPRREPAHSAMADILIGQKRFKDALEVAGAGLEAVPLSPRLHLDQSLAMEGLGRIYDARRALDSFAPQTDDVAFIRHQAEVSDVFGGNAPLAYRRLMAVLAKQSGSQIELNAAIERGWRVAIRDGDIASAAWFEEQRSKSASGKTAVSSPAIPPVPVQPRSTGVWVAGGFDALMFMARGPVSNVPSRHALEYCRTILSNSQGGDKSYQKAMSDYFTQLKTLMAMGVKTGNTTVLTLSTADRRNEKQVETVLDILGWKIRRNKQQLTVESGQKQSQASKQDLPSALAIDQRGMQSAFQAGKAFRIEIPWEWMPLAIDEAVLRQLSQSDKLPGGIPQALAENPDLSRFYVGMSRLDKDTFAALSSSINVIVLATRLSPLMEIYSSALAVKGGRVLVPGGGAADPVWTALAGAAPSNPTRFLKAIIEQDNGKLLAFFSALSQFDPPHQRFFTLSPKRAHAFYQLFSDSAEVRNGAGKPLRNGSVLEFLREIPLNDDDSVNFPGGAEVWMVAKGGSKSANQSEKMLRRVRRAVAPDIEDEILIRIATTHYSLGSMSFSETENFLAVAHIDAHRTDPLDEESALLLAQNVTAYKAFYPYFTTFTTLDVTDVRNFVSLAAKLTTLDPLDAELAMTQFFSLIELVRLGVTSGAITNGQSAALFRTVAAKFIAASDRADYTIATLDSVRVIAGESQAVKTDSAVALLVSGAFPQSDIEWNGTQFSLDPAQRRSVEFGRVLSLQKTPSLSELLAIDTAVRSLAAQKGAADELVSETSRRVAALPSVEITKADKFEGRSKQLIERFSLVKLSASVNALREKTLKRKANPKDVEKAAREILSEMGPQVSLALTGVIYAAYLRPDDSLVANDPLLLRKHQAFDVHTSTFLKPVFAPSDLVTGNSAGGSYFVGGFGQFAGAAGTAAGMSVKAGSPEAMLFASQTSATRMTAWSRYRDDDQQLLGLRIRIVREWFAYASTTTQLLDNLSEDTLGILSLARRRDLLNAIATQDWTSVWAAVTLSDQVFLAERYLKRYKTSPWGSSVDAALRQAGTNNDGSRINLLGAVNLTLYGCNHPHLVALAPYEQYENRMFPVDIAERTSEMKLYLSALLDNLALPAALLQSIAEPATKIAFRSVAMSDFHDWAQPLNVFRTFDESLVTTALGMLQ